MTRAKAPFDGLRVVSKVEPQSTPSINKIKVQNSKSEIQNKKGKLKILNSKHLTTREKFSLEGLGF